MKKILLIFCFVTVFTEVMSWTVDMSKVKKYLTENEVQTEKSNNVKSIESKLDENYARDFGYQNYKEKEVSSIIRNGSIYLEGLSKSLMMYRYKLNNCSITNNSIDNSNDRPNKLSTCESATNSSEYVQKLSDLALLTTNKLRDMAYKEYKDDDRDENELLLQLAWLLDRLAHLTGYEVNPKQYIDTETLTSTSEPIKRDTESLEILEQTENGRPLLKLPPKNLKTVKKIQKRSVENPLESVMKYYVKYKVWNSSNAIGSDLNNKVNNFDVQNDLTVKTVSKRSINKLFRRIKNKVKNKK